MAQALVALNAAREYLNDSAVTLWSDLVLIPKLQKAHREMQVKLQLAGIPVIRAGTSILSVPAGTTDLTTVIGYPADLIEPRWMKERMQGELEQDFVDMTECADIPSIQKSTELVWWCWQGEKILLLGSTQNREVRLRYIRGLPVPQANTDQIGYLFGENYLGPRTASLAAQAVEDPQLYQSCFADAAQNMQDLIRMGIKQLQNLPTNRRPYHRGRGRTRALRDF
jgi:hypothetical protein